ncbi:50S ribosomal protein L28 [bacterium (Candidatus Howlettbacteria) CG_4_10_14_0_8_um_filter_40_9]|nr:MAG: 50S ribosomal protein L28 [bacterium (Candidatus Howlettbacteria) CG_4_10_14_0_8_um_filter_40_9]
MSKVCQICSKGPVSGNNVSHSHRKTKRRWLPNLQKAKVFVNGREVSMRICTGCIKTQSKVRVAKTAESAKS